jgi:hypothetical protein
MNAKYWPCLGVKLGTARRADIGGRFCDKALILDQPVRQVNLVYTRVTRGKRLVVLVEQRKALAIAGQGKPGEEAVVEATGLACSRTGF